MKTNSWTTAGQAKDISSSPNPLVKVLRRGRHWVWGPNYRRAIKEWSIAINIYSNQTQKKIIFWPKTLQQGAAYTDVLIAICSSLRDLGTQRAVSSNFKSLVHQYLLNVVNRFTFSWTLQIWYVEVRISRNILESIGIRDNEGRLYIRRA